MTGRVHLDTHVVVWLAAGESDRLPQTSRDLIVDAEVFISPMVRLELQLLHEKKRISAGPDAVLEPLVSALGLRQDPTPFSEVVSSAIQPDRTWPHRDPFDRLIAAGAFAAGALLVTKDALLRKQFSTLTRWE